MQNLSGKSILFFCPKFFSYEREIKRSLENFGAKVTWFDDRPSNNFYSKALIRLNKNFLKNKINKYYDQILKDLKGEKFDYLFFVNPESISLESLIKLKAIFPKAVSILYMWDSFRNRTQNLELLPLFNFKFTFDPKDALAYDLKFRALFYTELYRKTENSDIKYDLMFVGTAHSDRYTFVKKVSESGGFKNVMLYFFLSSKLIYFFRRVFDRSFISVKYRDISFEPLTQLDIANLMNESRIVLDINHPKQIGLTMRTFETFGIQRKLITTNEDIKKYDFYDSSNILVLDRERPLLNKEFLETPFQNSSLEMLEKYSIKGWIREIFGLI